ncbi:MAG TPA: type IV secretion system DNA-binding domain-containing protein [Clostridia bacterium]|nr:type IV secretion system DNA-binding domain-containing protein [Clostridia bacterium]
MAITTTILHGHTLDESIRQTTGPTGKPTGNLVGGRTPGHMLDQDRGRARIPSAPRGVKVVLPGLLGKNRQNIDINEDILSKHILLLGGTGSGKTNLLYYFIKQLKNSMTANDVMIIFDTKGDFFDKFYKPGDTVLANSKQYKSVMQLWNIYKEIVADGWEDADILANTHEIIGSLFRDASEKSSQPFFPNAARDLLASLIVAHIRVGRDDLSIKRRFFNNEALKQYLDMLTPDKIRALLGCFPDLRSVLTYIGDGSSDQALGVMAELQSVVRRVLMGSFSGDGRFSVRNFVRSKAAKTLFIEYDLAIGETLTPIYRLLFDLALKEAMGRQKTEGNVYLICDEFKLLPHLHHIEDGVNFGRSLGVKVIAGIQSIEQLYQIYGERKGKNIAAGFSSVFAFKAGDPGTRDYVSRLYGKNIVLEQYKTAANTLVEKRREGNTVEDWNLTNLSIGEAIVGLPFQQPFRFKFDIYRG